MVFTIALIAIFARQLHVKNAPHSIRDTDETCLDNFDKFKDFLLDPAMAWRPLTFLEMQVQQ